MASRRIIDVQVGDPEWVSQLEKDLHNLCGLVEEAFQENRVLLLSPVCREMIRDRGREVQAKLDKVRNRLCVDNPNEPLKQVKGGAK